MGVHVREKRGKLYLDVYQNGRRSWEALHLTLTQDKEQNKAIRKRAELCCSMREMQINADVWNVQDTTAGRDSARAFLFGYYTGLRISDLRSLNWGKINRKPLQIMKRQKKTGREVYVPLAPAAWALIDDGVEHKAEDVIFNMQSESTEYKQLGEWGEAAGIKKRMNWHLARRTFATQSLEAGAEIYTVAKLLGHTGLAQVARYAAATDKLKREAVERLPDIN